MQWRQEVLGLHRKLESELAKKMELTALDFLSELHPRWWCLLLAGFCSNRCFQTPQNIVRGFKSDEGQQEEKPLPWSLDSGSGRSPSLDDCVFNILLCCKFRQMN